MQTVEMLRPAQDWRALLLLLCLSLAGCGLGGEASYPQPRYKHQNTPVYRQSASSSIFRSGSSNSAGSSAATAPNTATGADNRLWRASLETVSFMPLASADITKGVITTDWYSAPDTPKQRQKVTVHVLGRELRPDSLSVSVMRQQRGDDGTWAGAPSADAATDFATTILTRARQLSALEFGHRRAFPV